MVDIARRYPGPLVPAAVPVRGGMRRFIRRRSTIAFLMCLPLIAIVVGLIIYPFLYSLFLATLNKAQTKFVGLGNFSYLLRRDTFWMVVEQSAIFALTAVFFKAVIGLLTAHLVNNLPSKGQRKWRGMLLVPWVIPLALSTLGWWWLFDPTHSAFNWLIEGFGGCGYLATVILPSRLSARLRGPDGGAVLHRFREPSDPLPALMPPLDSW